ncbi:hypothetical protein [Desulfurivibrio alkaliphilus]|uniref:Uncharacterized protein n=1 Tax=Desulfurivibrio alkaliphilus (strain DSM 19089 / UNIQEM U267 / AHT2) TaxID=589865 RepID=D6Z5C0_DESAT|nr:hypothetical protein [Desulfurivibrio alkaliphilus]ADH84777.1 hypothetical protein DaAHT2_0064 [Desulfurivibrio alkaliphilus AHT 2]
MKSFITVLLVLFLAAACGQEKQEMIGTEAGPAPEEGYIVQVGESYITPSDVEQELQGMPESRRLMYETPDGQDRLFDEMIKREMFRQEAVRAGLDQSEAYRKRVEYLARLALVEMFLEEKIQASVTVSDREVQDYYEANKDTEFTNPLSGETQPFTSVRNSIRRLLLLEKQREAFDKYMEDMMGRYVVRVSDDYRPDSGDELPMVEEGFGQLPDDLPAAE